MPIDSLSKGPGQIKKALLCQIYSNLSSRLYNLAKESQLETKQAFAAIYTAFIGSTHGPRAAWFLLQYPKEQVIERLKEASVDSGLASPTGRRPCARRANALPILPKPFIATRIAICR